MGKSCKNCLHQNDEVHDWPCRNCDECSEWAPGERCVDGVDKADCYFTYEWEEVACRGRN